LLKGAVIKNLTVQLNVYEILLAIRDVERRFDILLNCKPSMPIGSGFSWDIVIVDNCTIQLNDFPLFETPLIMTRGNWKNHSVQAKHAIYLSC
jgi:hypothetical protein